MIIQNISLRGLRSVLRKFDEDGKLVSGTHWKIARGGYDLYWQLYYDNIPIIDCVCNRIENNCIRDKDYKRIAQVILEEYDTDKWQPMSVKPTSLIGSEYYS